MTPQQLELLVLQSVHRVRTGQQSEDDRIEIKREWPTDDKARQLAGAANRLQGLELIYIIGLDEKTGLVHPTASTKVADWWPQMAARFDGASPNLVRHLTVAIDDRDSVTALEFATDRAPYVVLRPGGSPEREVPIREGTRTRSARRDELLTLLVPAVATPGVTVLEATCSAAWRQSIDQRNGDLVEEYIDVQGRARCFLEHVGAQAILLPSHRAAGRLSAGSYTWTLGVDTGQRRDEPIFADPFGVVATPSGVVATGPGVFDLTYRARLMSSQWEHLESSESIALELELGVATAPRPVYAAISLKRGVRFHSTDSDSDSSDLPSEYWGYRARAAYIDRPPVHDSMR